MYAHVVSLGVTGLDGYPVTVETHISGGLPKFAMVGLPDSAVRESGDRVRSAVKNLGYKWPDRHITVNLAPSMMETHFLKDTPDLIVQAAAADNPMGRNATPEDVAPAMAFLLSEEARFITGVTLPVTGGSAIV